MALLKKMSLILVGALVIGLSWVGVIWGGMWFWSLLDFEKSRNCLAWEEQTQMQYDVALKIMMPKTVQVCVEWEVEE